MARTGRRAGAAATAVVLAALVAPGCRRHPGDAPRPLVLVDLRQPATSLTFVAEAAGCFEREGARVERRTLELGRDALTQLQDGSADVAVAFETPTLVRWFDDDRLRVLATLHTSTSNTRIVARRDHGIAEAADLRGKRIGSARGTNTDFFVSTLLTFAGLDPSEVTVVDLEPAASVDALAAGAIDAAALFDPHAERARAVLGDAAVELRTDLHAEYSLVVTRADVLAARRPELRALLRGLSCAARVAHERPEEAFQAVRARLPERSEAELRAALGRVRRGLDLDGVLLTVLRRESEWLWDETRAAPEVAPPDATRLVYPAVLDEVDPEAVNLPGTR